MAVNPSEIEQKLNAILASPEFASSPKMQALLRYIVEASVNGDGDKLKGYTIGLDVFDRGEDFDPRTDSIVRVQMARLRELLQK